MVASTKIKQILNGCLGPLGLKIETRLQERLEADRLQQLVDSKYFDLPAFPVPECVETCDWQSLVPVFEKYRASLNRLQSADDNDVGFSNANTFYHPPDSDVLYCMVRELRPNRVIEIGSGNSTRLSRQAIIDGKLTTRITSIDPYPRAEIDGFADEIRRQRVEGIPAVDLAGELDAGDFLFIDSSHLVAVGNDCTYEFLQLLPRIKPGVVIHIHDISLPWDYPMDWIRREQIVAQWAEQHLLQAMLQSSDSHEVLWPGYYVQRTSGEEFDRWFPRRMGRDATSFWMKKRP